MSVVARFYVAGYERQAYDPDAVIVTLRAVSRGQHNKNWAAATPYAELKMTIKNSAAGDQFIDGLGKEFEVVFTPAAGDD